MCNPVLKNSAVLSNSVLSAFKSIDENLYFRFIALLWYSGNLYGTVVLFSRSRLKCGNVKKLRSLMFDLLDKYSYLVNLRDYDSAWYVRQVIDCIIYIMK